MRKSERRASDDRYKWWVLITVVFGAFASILDSTIVNTALPRIQADFGADLHEASYVATGYTLAAGVIVPASGFLANRFGIKRIYLASLTLFTLGSALCGLAPSMPALIGFRILQGAGGAALFPLSFALLFAAFPQEERGKANGYFGIPVLVAPAIGPTVGGFIVQYVDWRWIFYINLPIGLAGVLLGRALLREAPPRPELRFDAPGFLFAASGLGLLLYGLSNLAYDGWGSVRTVSGPVIAAVALLLIFVPLELRRRQPLLDLRLFRRRNFALGNLIIWLATVGLFVPAFLLPQYLQVLRGQTPSQAGLLLLWQGVGAVIGTLVSGQMYNRAGVRVLISAGALLSAATGLWLGEWTTATAALSVLPWILLPRGLAQPLVLQSANTSALVGISGPALPQATTLTVVARNVVVSLSIAVMTNVLAQRIVLHVTELARRAGQRLPGSLSLSIGASRHLPAFVREGSAQAFHDVFLITGVTIVPALALAWFLQQPHRAGATARAAQPEEEPGVAR